MALPVSIETADPIEVGDIVTLASGGPDLTVVDTCECGNVHVVWFDGGQLEEAVLPEEALVL